MTKKKKIIKKPMCIKEFHDLGELITFCVENNKKIVYDSGDISNGIYRNNITFMDGSYVEIIISDGAMSDSGTWWPGDTKIKYYEKN